MGAPLTSEQRFTRLKRKFWQMGRLPGNRHRFSSDEAKPVSAEMATRPITPEEEKREEVVKGAE